MDRRAPWGRAEGVVDLREQLSELIILTASRCLMGTEVRPRATALAAGASCTRGRPPPRPEVEVWPPTFPPCRWPGGQIQLNRARGHPKGGQVWPNSIQRSTPGGFCTEVWIPRGRAKFRPTGRGPKVKARGRANATGEGRKLVRSLRTPNPPSSDAAISTMRPK